MMSAAVVVAPSLGTASRAANNMNAPIAPPAQSHVGNPVNARAVGAGNRNATGATASNRKVTVADASAPQTAWPMASDAAALMTGCRAIALPARSAKIPSDQI